MEAVHVIDGDMIRTQAAETFITGLKEEEAGRPEIVNLTGHGKGGFGGDQQFVAATLDGLAEDLFRGADAVDVSGIKEVDARFETLIDEAGGFFHLGIPPCFEEFSTAAEGSGTIAEYGDADAAQLSVFHEVFLQR